MRSTVVQRAAAINDQGQPYKAALIPADYDNAFSDHLVFFLF